MQDETWQDVLAFLQEAERHGKGMAAAFEGAGTDGAAAQCDGSGMRSVDGEARALRRLFVSLRD